MQTKTERELLRKTYSNASASPRALLAGCAVGLCAIATIAAAGMLAESDPVALANLSQNESARVAVTQAAADHQRSVFLARQEQFTKRGAPSMYASATGVAPGR